MTKHKYDSVLLNIVLKLNGNIYKLSKTVESLNDSFVDYSIDCTQGTVESERTNCLSVLAKLEDKT